MTHALKTDSPFFKDVVDGYKTFELRKDDRPFNAGDYVLLQEYVDKKYTGQEYKAQIVYILRSEKYGLKKGYCILGIKEVEH